MQNESEGGHQSEEDHQAYTFQAQQRSSHHAFDDHDDYNLEQHGQNGHAMEQNDEDDAEAESGEDRGGGQQQYGGAQAFGASGGLRQRDAYPVKHVEHEENEPPAMSDFASQLGS